MSNIGDKLALQAIGNAYKIAQHNERQRFNELAAYVRVAYANGMSQRHISEAVKLHRQTVADRAGDRRRPDCGAQRHRVYRQQEINNDKKAGAAMLRLSYVHGSI